MRVVCVVGVVVPLRVRAERGVVDVWSQCQRCAATPPADQLRRDQFPFCFGVSVRLQESIECTDSRLIFAKPHKGPVAAEDDGLRHWERDTGLTWVPEDELSGLDRPTLAWQWLNAAALDRRLVDPVFVAQGIAIVRLRAKVLHRQNADAREALVLLAGNGEGAPPLLFGIAEGGYPDMNPTRAKRLVPALRIVEAVVTQ